MDNQLAKIYEQLLQQYQQYYTCVKIDNTRLSDEVIEHAENKRKIMVAWVRARRLVSECIRTKATMFADCCSDFRRDQNDAHNEGTGAKPTKDSVEQATRSDKDYLEACTWLLEAEEICGKLEVLGECMTDRGWRLRDLVRLYLTQNERDYIRDDKQHTPAHTRYGLSGGQPTYQENEENEEKPEPIKRRRVSDAKA